MFSTVLVMQLVLPFPLLVKTGGKAHLDSGSTGRLVFQCPL
jgi:hypothetical protein